MAWGQVCWDRRKKPWTGKQNKLQQLRMKGTESLYEEARSPKGDRRRSEGLVAVRNWRAGHWSLEKDCSRASGEEACSSQARGQRRCGEGLQT